ncbi:MAG: UDP-N-acetylmuramoyl-L-alanyl-D-glutamate--2,6-diaminopimelate ligase [Treponema sp.]|nr:UDP-N-acetylmuramoyl-L-alanyl-D-glutamate--2,6-diaminopimelate ligase [Treponema sp.]
MIKKLSELLTVFDYKLVSFDGKTEYTTLPFNPEIKGLAFDSRNVKEDFIFFALPGTHTTGNIFIPKAIKNGATVIIFQDQIDENTAIQIKNELDSINKKVVFINVKDSRYVMAPISAHFYDNPSEKLIVIGVTGTEGKSSTVSFVWQLLQLSGHKAGFISTVQYSLGDEAISNPEHQTTPEATIIQRQLYEMVQNKCEYAVVETSSHGLSPKLNRTGSLLFDCGIFMNVTLEHLEFHGTFQQYRNDKANLFRKLDEHNHIKIINGEKRQVPSFGIINLEDPSAEYFLKATNQLVIGFTTKGKAGKSAENTQIDLPPIPKNIPVIFGTNIESSKQGLSFDFSYTENYQENCSSNSQLIHVDSSLPGAFNTYNLMAAIMAVSKLTNNSANNIAEFVKNVIPVKGRMTVINQQQPFELIIDYAHTPSSFETIFPPIRKRCTGKMIAVFGSGGERDLKKRPLQGEIAAKFCDIVILADEDPRGENPEELLNMIAEGAQKLGKQINQNLYIIPDRPKAIRKALQLAQENDIVLLLGKSHENSIIYKDYIMPYDEIEEAKKALDEMGYKK